MRGRIPYTFKFHGFFGVYGEREVTMNDVDNLFTKRVGFYGVNDIVQRANVQPLTVPFPLAVSPYLKPLTVTQRSDAVQFEDMPIQADWFYVNSVQLMRVDSEAAPDTGAVQINWKDRIIASTDQGIGSSIFIPTDPWTNKAIKPRSGTTAVRADGNVNVTDQTMIAGGTFPIGSPQSSLDKGGWIVPKKFKNSTPEIMNYYPGAIFMHEPISLLMRDQISMKGVLVGYRGYFMLDGATGDSLYPQAKHNHYDGNKFPVISIGLGSTNVPTDKMTTGVTNMLNYHNYNKVNISWMFDWREEDDNVALTEIAGTALARYQHELPDISFLGPGRELDHKGLEEGFLLSRMELIEAIVNSVNVAIGTAGVVSGFFAGPALMSLLKTYTNIYKDMLLKDARQKDMENNYTDQPIDTHYMSANSLIKTSNTYIDMAITYPQAELVGGPDNNMFNNETQAQVSIPINKLFKSLQEFSDYLKLHDLTDVVGVDYVPFMSGYEEKWDLMNRFGFKRTEYLNLPKGSKRNGDRYPHSDRLKRIGRSGPSILY